MPAHCCAFNLQTKIWLPSDKCR